MYCLEKLQKELAYFLDIDLRELPRVQDLLKAKGYTQVQKGDEVIQLDLNSLELENLDAIKFNPSGKDLMEQSPKSKDIDTANFNAPSENPSDIIPQNHNYKLPKPYFLNKEAITNHFATGSQETYFLQYLYDLGVIQDSNIARGFDVKDSIYLFLLRDEKAKQILGKNWEDICELFLNKEAKILNTMTREKLGSITLNDLKPFSHKGVDEKIVGGDFTDILCTLNYYEGLRDLPSDVRSIVDEFYRNNKENTFFIGDRLFIQSADNLAEINPEHAAFYGIELKPQSANVLEMFIKGIENFTPQSDLQNFIKGLDTHTPAPQKADSSPTPPAQPSSRADEIGAAIHKEAPQESPKADSTLSQEIKDIIDSSPEKGRDMQIIGEANFTPQVVEYAHKNNKKVAIDKLDKAEAEQLGFKHPSDVRVTIDYQAINHTLNRHGADSPLAQQSGQKAVDYTDIAEYRSIVKGADEKLFSKDDLGQDVILSFKQINGHSIVVESIRKKGNELAFKSMYFENGSYKNSNAYKNAVDSPKADPSPAPYGYEPHADASTPLLKTDTDTIPQTQPQMPTETPRGTEDRLETQATMKSLFDYTYEPKITETQEKLTIQTIDDDVKTTKIIDKTTGKVSEQSEIIPAPKPKKRAEQDLVNLNNAIKDHWLKMVQDEAPAPTPKPTPEKPSTPKADSSTTPPATPPKPTPTPQQMRKVRELEYSLRLQKIDLDSGMFTQMEEVNSKDTDIVRGYRRRVKTIKNHPNLMGKSNGSIYHQGQKDLDLERKDLAQELGITPAEQFGKNYTEFYRNGAGAIEKLLLERQGQVAGAFYREELGDIDVFWGDSSKGLAHIFERRMQDFIEQGFSKEEAEAKAIEFIKTLPDIIENGAVEKRINRAFIDTQDKRALIALDFNGEDKKWVITAYNKNDALSQAEPHSTKHNTNTSSVSRASGDESIIPQTTPQKVDSSEPQQKVDSSGEANEPKPLEVETAKIQDTPDLEPKPNFYDYHLKQPRDEINDPATRLANNIEALKIIKELDESQRPATPKEQDILANFSGFGGLTNAFKEGSESLRTLQELVSADDLPKLRQTILDAYYTPEKYIKLMYESLEAYLPKKANVLEPSMGSGRFLTLGNANYNYTGIDLDTITYKIAQALHPNQNLANGDFLKTPLAPNQFDLVIGNPPYGETKVKYKDMQGLNLHSAFMMKNIDLARENGIIAQVVSASFLDSISVSTHKARHEMVKKARIAGILRLPSDSFSGTSLATDIIILQKREKPLTREQLEAGEGLTEWEQKFLSTPSEYKEGTYENGVFRSPSRAMRLLADMKSLETGNYGTKRIRYEAYRDKEFEAGIIKDWQEELSRNLKPVKPSTKAVDSLKDLQKLQDQSDFKSRDIGKLTFNGTDILQSEVRVLDDGTKILEQKKKDLDEFVLTKLKENKQGETIIDDSELVKYRDLIKRKDSLKGAEKGSLTRMTKKLEQTKAFFTTYQQLRDAQTLLRKSELDPDISDKELEQLRKNLNDLYDQTIENQRAYTNTPELIHNSVLRNVFRQDMGFTELQALERAIFDDNGVLLGVEKSDIFFKRLNNPTFTPTTASSTEQALQFSLQYKGAIDYAYMAEILGKNAHSLRQELIDDNKIFIVNASGQEGTIDELLAGNIRQKLKELNQTLEEGTFDESLLQNSIETIKQNMPELKTFDQIKWSIQSSFIPERVWRLWQHAGGFRSHIIKGEHNRYYAKGFSYDYAPSLQNSKPATDADVFNTASGFIKKSFKDADDALRFDMAVQKMTKEFESFVLNNDEAIKLIEQNYNETMNIYAKSSFQAAAAEKGYKFANANPDIQLRPTQIRASFRAVYSPINTLFNHEVGAGKTFTIITTAMELKRIGKATKPVIAVPQHLVPQFTNEFYQLYPGAKLLSLQSIAQKDFKIAQAQIAYNEFDCIIVSHRVLDNMEMPRSYQLEFYNDMLYQRTQTAQKIEAQEGAGQNLRKTEAEIKKIKKKIEDLQESAKDSKQVTLDFNELGIDALLVDEAHEYKNLAFSSTYEVKGMGTAKGGAKTTSLLMKTQFLNDNNKRIVFATGTPMANSLLEIHHMLNYLHPQGLKELGISHIDNFISNFVRSDKILETKASGGKEFVETIVGVKNNQELMQLVNKVFDTIDFETVEREAREAGIEVIRPNQKNTNIVVEKYAEVKDIYDNIIIPEALLLKSDPSKAMEKGINPLTIFTKAKKLSVDPRLVKADLVEVFKKDPQKRKDTKIYKCAQNILAKEKEWDDRITTQLVFCDLKESDGVAFNAHEQLREYLLQDLKDLGGNYTKDQIVCIDDIDKKDYAKLYSKINKGEVKVLITTTGKTGTGANLQQKLVAMHHLDAPYRPSDFIQRIGRMIRQGNEYAKAWAEALKKGEQMREFYAENQFYIVEDTLDARLFEILENKARAFGDFFKGVDVDLEVDTKAMVDYGILKAEASGNKNELEFYKVQHELKNLQSKKQINLEEFMGKGKKIQELEARKNLLQGELEMLQVFKPSAESSEVEFMSKTYSFDFSKSQDKPNTLIFDDEKLKNDLQNLRDIMNKNKKEILEPLISGKQNFLHIYSYGGADLVVVRSNLDDEVSFCFEKDGQRLYIDARRKLSNFSPSDTLNFIKTLHNNAKRNGAINRELVEIRALIKRTEALTAEFAEQDKINALEAYLNDLAKAIQDGHKEPIAKPAEVAKFFGIGSAIGLGAYASLYAQNGDFYEYKS